MSPHDPLVALIKDDGGQSQGEREKTLTRLLFEKAPPEDLQAIPPTISPSSSPAGSPSSPSASLAAARSPSPIRTAPFGDVTFIDILNDDMPFLVDSTIAPPDRARS